LTFQENRKHNSRKEDPMQESCYNYGINKNEFKGL